MSLSNSYGLTLSPEQAAVRDHVGGDQVVVAGAGTGKTETLTQRILKLLLAGDGQSGPIPLDGVLALTFTDKAAAEMRARVYGGIVARLRAATDAREKSRLEELRAEFGDRNRIGTFDAFNRRILAQFPDHSPFTPNVDVLDAGARLRMRRDLTRAFWERCEALPDAERELLWEWLRRWKSRRGALDAVILAAQEDETALGELAHLPEPEVWRAQIEVWADQFEARAGTRYADELARAWRLVETEVEAMADLPDELRAGLLDAERVRAGGRAGVCNEKGWMAAWEKKCPFDWLEPLSRRVLPLLQRWRIVDKSGAPTLERSEAAW